MKLYGYTVACVTNLNENTEKAKKKKKCLLVLEDRVGGTASKKEGYKRNRMTEKVARDQKNAKTLELPTASLAIQENHNEGRTLRDIKPYDRHIR